MLTFLGVVLVLCILRSLELYGSGWEFKEIVVLWNHYMLFSNVTREELYEKNYIQKDRR